MSDQLIRYDWPCLITLYTFNNVYVCMAYVFDLYVGDWIRERFEAPNAMQISDQNKKDLLSRLIRSTM